MVSALATSAMLAAARDAVLDLPAADRQRVETAAGMPGVLSDATIAPEVRAALVLVVECAALIWLAQEPQVHNARVLPRPTHAGVVALTDHDAAPNFREHTMFSAAAAALGWRGVGRA